MPMWRASLVLWVTKTVVDPFMQILKRGADPNELAFSTALGFTLGIFPICGATVFLCGAAITLLGNRCHAPSLLLANFVATPVELSLMIPFLRLGELICGGARFPLTSDALKKVVTGQASWEIVLSIYHALLGWFLAAPFILGLLYVALSPLFEVLVSKYGNRPSSPMKQLHPFSEMKERFA